jgi:hypothetical protein
VSGLPKFWLSKKASGDDMSMSNGSERSTLVCGELEVSDGEDTVGAGVGMYSGDWAAMMVVRKRRQEQASYLFT